MNATGDANQVLYKNASNVATTSSNFTFNGTTAISVNGVNVGNGVTTGFYGDADNLAVRVPKSGGGFYVQSPSGAANWALFQSSGLTVYGTINATNFSGGGAFASGTTILFYQAAAPTGWTKSTSHDNKALRVVSGPGGGSGGSSSFTSVFASRAVPLPEHNHSASSGNHDGHQHSGPTNSQSIDHSHSFTTGNQSANHTHTFTTGNQNADHNHGFTTNGVGDHQHSMNLYSTGSEAGGYGFSGPGGAFENRVKVSAPASDYTNSAGAHSHDGATAGQSANHQHGGTTDGMSADHNHSGTTSGGGGSHSHDFTTQTGGSHSHSISVSNNGTASASMDFAVQYIDVIICSKN